MSRLDIRNLTDRLIEDLKLEVPINLTDFINAFDDLTIEYNQNDLDKEGKITPVDGIYTIYLKGTGQTERDRFTIAHELGHLFLGHLSEYEELYRNGANEVEYEANEFAAELLMPVNQFKNSVKKYTDEDGNCDIVKVSEEFKVSKAAVLTRGRFLRLFSW